MEAKMQHYLAMLILQFGSMYNPVHYIKQDCRLQLIVVATAGLDINACPLAWGK